jgi:hypothetical protein
MVTGQGGSGTALGVVMTTRLAAQKPTSLEKSGGAPPWDDGDCGSARLQFPCSLDKNDGGTVPPTAVTGWCTTLTMVVYTRHADATPVSAALG